MKKIYYILYIIVVIMLCISTFYYYQENNKLILTNNYLETEITALQQTEKDLSSNIEVVKNELLQLKNEPSNLIIQIRNAYENKNYEDVKELSQKLHTSSNGTDYDIEAQNYVKKIEEIEKKSAIQKAKEIIEISNASVKKNYYYYYSASSNLFENMSVEISYKINTNKDIIYVDFSISALNSKGEIINFNTNGSATSCIETLLFPTSNQKGTYTFEKDWNNMATTKIVVNSITVTYDDGSKDYLERVDGFNYAFVKHTENKFKNVSTSSTSTQKIEKTVYITSSGTKYHRSSCSYLKSKISITESEAIKKGYTACSRCNP